MSNSIERNDKLFGWSSVTFDLKYDLSFFSAENDLSAEQLDIRLQRNIVNAMSTFGKSSCSFSVLIILQVLIIVLGNLFLDKFVK